MPNIAIPTPPGSWFGLKFHQVAIYVAEMTTATGWWEDRGYTAWVWDTATLRGVEKDDSGEYVHSTKVGHMAFNYDILPCELEYVRYETPTRNPTDDRDGSEPFISHMSTYVSDIKDEISRLYVNHDVQPYHRFYTSEHHNKGLPEGTYFEEAIYDTRRFLGFDLKLIQKVTAEDQLTPSRSNIQGAESRS